MSYLRTKPRWCPTVEATEQGWINSLNGELLVSLRGLKTLIAAEEAAIAAALPQPAVEPVKEVIVMQEEVKVEVQEPQVVLKEETVKKPKKKQKLLGEVVEFPMVEGAQVIGE
jgi:hypothetical protein